MPKKVDFALSVGLGFVAFFLYLSTLAPTLLFADGGEFQFVPYVLGIAHPTGYPLYLILGWLWSHLLPLGHVAYRMNLFSALWGGVAVGLLYLVGIRALVRAGVEPISLRQGLASMGALTLATSGTLWSKAVEAEVYTLNAAFVALTLLLLLVWAERKRTGLLYLFALFYGLGLAHHGTIILLAPAYLLFIWLTDPRPLRELRSLATLLLLSSLPLLLYLYIPLRAPHTSYLRIPLGPGTELVLYESSLKGFLRLVLSQTLGSQRLSPSGSISEHLLKISRLLGSEFTAFGLVLGLLGWLRSFRARNLLALTSLSYLAVLLFGLLGSLLAYLFRFTGDIKAFLLPAHIIFALWIALGGAALVEAIARLLKGATARFILLAILALLPLSLLTKNFSSVDRSQDFRALRFWDAILTESIPKGAILVSNDRNEMMPLWYLQQVEGVRPDLLGLFPLIVPEEGYANIGRLLDSVFGLGRPVYLIKEMPGLEIKYELRRVNSLVEILSPAVTGAPDYPRNLLLGEALELIGYDQEPHSLRPGEELRVTLYWRPRRSLESVYSSYLHLVNKEGQAIAQSDHQPGGVYYPTSLWKEGESIRDEHTLTIPSTASLGSYRLLAGIYAQEPLGEGLTIGMVGVKRAILTSPGEMEHPLGINLGNRVTLLGYDLQHLDGEIILTFYWQARREMGEDYTVFVHLLDGEEIVAQADSQPQDGDYPTSIWDEGEVVIDKHRLTTGELPPGEHDLWAGIYLLETMERLPVIDAQGEKIGEGVNLGTIQIE